eukprot:scaffold3952_cov191-Skeletonema_marinoi.AAC.3
MKNLLFLSSQQRYSPPPLPRGLIALHGNKICQCGLGVAVVDLNGPNGLETRVYNAGPGDREDPWGPDNHWEIASVTKPFTAVAMLVLEDEGILTRDTTIGELLPCDWEKANSDVASIKLIEIVTHLSGLPAQPPDRGPSIGGNPFANYTEDRLCTSLLKLNGLPTRGRYSYSNYAYGTLGYALTLAIDPVNPPDYEDIIKRTILNPLQMFNSSVTYDEAGWKEAAVGCARGIKRNEETIRLGAYSTLQGNGAFRSTQNDMAKFLRFMLFIDSSAEVYDETLFGPAFPPSDELTRLTAVLKGGSGAMSFGDDLACSCVSDWCEGYLCPLPDASASGIPPRDLIITAGGWEGYTSGGYSSRVGWSFAKGRAAVAADTCGGCGSIGTAGSAPQRAVHLLVDGPPAAAEPAVKQDYESNAYFDTKRIYKGNFESHSFPSRAEIVVEVMQLDESVVEVAVSSSDGAGATSNATYAGNGMWFILEPVLFGSGWGKSNDPFTSLAQQRALIFSSGGRSVTFQDMGEDIARLDLQASSQVAATEDPASATNDGNDAVRDDGAPASGGAGDVPMSDEPSGSGRKLASATTRIVSAALRMFGI